MGVRRALVSVAVLVIALVVVLPGRAEAVLITVTTTADETTPNGLTSLREAFLAASGNAVDDTIQLQAGASYSLTLCASGPLTHTDDESLTVQGGAGTSLLNTCAGSQTIVDSDGTEGLTLRSFDLLGSSSGGEPFVDGLAVRQEAGGPLVLEDMVVQGFAGAPGSTVVDGGDFGTDATITSSSITGNTGTGVSLSFGSLTVDESTIEDNTGSGISLVDGTPLAILGSSVSDNGGSGATTTGQGNTVVLVADSSLDLNGGVGLSCSACDTVAVASSSISGNGATTTTGGGGVRATWDYDQVSDSPSLSITNSTVAFNRAVRPGAGVSVGFIEDSEPAATPGELDITGSNISANEADDVLDGDGGGVHATTGDVTVSGSTIAANSAGPSGGASSRQGGGIWHRELADLDGTRTLFVGFSDVSANRAGGSGGGIYAAHDGDVSVSGSSLVDNTAASGSGGGMVTAGTSTSVVSSRVQGNDADVGGGLAHESFSGLPVGSMTVDSSTLSGNSAAFAGSGGGGLFVNVGGAGALATVRNSTLTGNTSANFGGGAMVMQTSRLTLDHATVVDNTGGTGSNVYVAAGNFRTRRAAIALPDGGVNCAFFSAPSLSSGYSWADDTSCDLGATDVEAPGVDPKLGVLAGNGGPTPTRKPGQGTPLAIVPAGSCTLPQDQRGVNRPQGTNCEAGAVEVDEAAPK